jgi:predicted ribosome-associated RNA-binding protein Tma20
MKILKRKSLKLFLLLFLCGGFFVLNFNYAKAAPGDLTCNIGDATITAPASGALVNENITISWNLNGSDCDGEMFDILTSSNGTDWYTAVSTVSATSSSATFNSDGNANTPDASTYQFGLRYGSLIATTTYNDVEIDNTHPTISGVVGTSVHNAGDTIQITFSEAMDATTLTTSTGITSIVGSLSGTFDLSNASGVWSGGNQIFTITLDEDTDNDFIQDTETITVNLASTVTDVVGNTYSGAGVITSPAVSKESTAPTVTVSGASVNNGGDTVTLTFSENMATSTITTALLQANTNITIDISNNAGSDGEYDLDLSNATIAWTGLDTAVITLNELIDGAYIPNGKYVGVTLIGVTDLVGNLEAGAEEYSAAITGDVTAPTIIDDWALNMNSGTITLNFDEAMSTSTSPDTTKIAIEELNGAGGESYTLTGGTSTWNSYTSMTINLSITDLNALKLNTSIATSAANSYLKIIAGNSITDLAGNEIDLTNVTDGASINATTFTADTTAPSLVNWTLNMNTGSLVMNFDETVSTSTLAVGAITIQDAATSTTSYALTDSATASTNGTQVNIALSLTDLNAIKNDLNLATSTDSSYLTLTASAIDDMNGNSVNAILDGSAMQVLSYTADATVPTVTDWTLNINTGAMVINFSETMDQTVDVDETKITIQQSNDTSTAGEYYTLTDSTSVWTDHNTLTITLSATDLNALKRDTSLAISSATSYLEIAATNLIVDVVGLDLSLTNVTDGACLNVSSFTADTTAPTIVSQTPVDGSTGQAITINPTVTFSEPMDPDMINSTRIKLFKYSDNTEIGAGVSYDELTKTATIWPYSNLLNSTQYYIEVSGIEDMNNNPMTPYTTEADQEFTTIAQADGSLAISPPETIKPYAVADDSYANGWAWKFTITVPTSETSFKMKFDNWRSGDNTIESGANMRYYSTQATTATTSANAIDISTTGTYPTTAMTLTGDLDASTAGRQIEVYVEMKVPVGSSGGSYSAQYGILTN